MLLYSVHGRRDAKLHPSLCFIMSMLFQNVAEVYFDCPQIGGPYKASALHSRLSKFSMLCFKSTCIQ